MHSNLPMVNNNRTSPKQQHLVLDSNLTWLRLSLLVVHNDRTSPINNNRCLNQTCPTDDQQWSFTAGQQQPSSWFKPVPYLRMHPHRPYISSNDIQIGKLRCESSIFSLLFLFIYQYLIPWIIYFYTFFLFTISSLILYTDGLQWPNKLSINNNQCLTLVLYFLYSLYYFILFINTVISCIIYFYIFFYSLLLH